jgi:Glycosyl hydrolase 2 galactose-binding domain-like
MNGKSDKNHVIRLRGPWEVEPVARFVESGLGNRREETDGLPAGGKTPVPGDWGQLLGADFLGRVRYTRGFNLPTNLGPQERVWLVFDGVNERAQVALNGQPLGEFNHRDCPREFEITPLLLPHNRLTVEVCLGADTVQHDSAGEQPFGAGGLVGEVRLEIGPNPSTISAHD